MTGSGFASPHNALAELLISPEEVRRARRLAAAHDRTQDLTRIRAVDLADPVITHVERIAAGGDRPAVADAAGSLSYAELAVEARRLATLLERSGVTPGTVVAVGGVRCSTVVAAFLAIELVGALYLPVDATWPAARIGDVLGRADAVALLRVGDSAATSRLADGAAEAGCPTVRAADSAHCTPWHGSPRLASADQPRYVLFTSGSTGRPKGAVVEHRGMINHLLAKIVDLELSGADVVAQTAPLGFDISVWQLLCPLLIGGRTQIIGDDVAHDPARLAASVDRQGITVLELVPTMIRLLLDDLDAGGRETPHSSLACLRWMLATGEELPRELARRWLDTVPHARLLNAYGPTECSDDVTHHVVTRADLELLRLPIGRPVRGTRLYVLRRVGDAWAACGIDEAGELFVGGLGVGRGYIGDPRRTQDAFFQDPFESTETGRLYRTGDLVRLLPHGVLQYLGRVDRQVKIAGVRIELGEIEAVLQQHPAVDAAVVVTREVDTARSGGM